MPCIWTMPATNLTLHLCNPSCISLRHKLQKRRKVHNKMTVLCKKVSHFNILFIDYKSSKVWNSRHTLRASLVNIVRLFQWYKMPLAVSSAKFLLLGFVLLKDVVWFLWNMTVRQKKYLSPWGFLLYRHQIPILDPEIPLNIINYWKMLFFKY